MPAYYEWTTKKKGSKYSRGQRCTSFEVTNHPLKINVVTMKLSSSNIFIENLNKWSSAFEEIDPLLRFEQMNLEEETPLEPVDGKINYSKAWNSRHTAILNKYTTGEKLTIVSSFLPGGEKALIRQVSNLNEKVKHRLEQLDDIDETSVRRTMGLSQQEYVTKINLLNDEIKKAWQSEQRVKAFKICIQCSKLLSDISVMQFYPSKFVLITDILDNFGNLVFERLRSKSFGEHNTQSPEEINSKSVPEQAKETCQNWLFKMASIRELLPRLYMEMALLKCYLFLNRDDINSVIARLTIMIRGIGNPLVASYLRLYLCRVASKLVVECESYFYDNLKEFIEDYQQIFHTMMRKKHEVQLLTLDRYLNLYVPAVDWLLYGTLNSNRCKLTLLENFLKQIETMENNELLLSCVVSAFDSSTIIKKSTEILNLIQSSSERMVLTNELLSSLGEHLCATENYRQLSSESLIETWWKMASTLKPTNHFLQVLVPWIQFASTHLSSQHVNIILRGSIRYMVKCGQPADDFSGNFQFIIRRMLKSVPDVEEVFLMDAFMPLLDLVQTTNARTLLSKTVLSMFFSRYERVYIEDHIVIGSLMRLCCILHDSINAVTVDDECKVCAELINKFIHAVSYQDDLEQQLNFYVECRAAFIKLDAVLIALVYAVNRVCVRAGVSGERWLQRACAAFCFVTVPSLHCALTKAQLYLLSGQVALLNNCVGQAEANFKALIGLIPDIPDYILEDGQKKSTHTKVSALISDFLSTLLTLPDNLDSANKAYILSGFIKTMEKIHWQKTEGLYYSTLLQTLDLLCEMTQETYAYRIDAVLSNDKLYGADSEFVDAIEKYATNICQELLVVLKALEDTRETKKQHSLALELFWRVVKRGDIESGPMFSLAAKLWTLALKVQGSNDKVAKAMMSSLQNDSSPATKRLLQKLEV